MTQTSRNTCTWICDDGWCHLSNVQNPYDIPLKLAGLTGILIMAYYRQYNPPISATTRAQGELITASSSDIKLSHPETWDSNHSADCSSETEAFCPMTWFHRFWNWWNWERLSPPRCAEVWFREYCFFSKNLGGKIDDWEGYTDMLLKLEMLKWTKVVFLSWDLKKFSLKMYPHKPPMKLDYNTDCRCVGSDRFQQYPIHSGWWADGIDGIEVFFSLPQIWEGIFFDFELTQTEKNEGQHLAVSWGCFYDT